MEPFARNPVQGNATNPEEPAAAFRWSTPQLAAPTSTALTIHPDQQRINQYIMAELMKLKGDNKRLNDELLVLRMENMHLTQRISSMPTYGLPITYPVPDEMAALPLVAQQGTFNPSKPQQDLPFVEFDMRRTPPTVQSANVMFCSLLGYTTEEVLGKPWQYFIQDDYVERTVRMLQRDAGAKQMRFGQVYKDRHGRPVPCQDLHTFNRDEKGRVITDYVIVKPEGAPHQGTQPLAMFSGQAQKTISVKRPMPSIMGNGGVESMGTSPLMMMDESEDPFDGASPPPPLFAQSGEWNLPSTHAPAAPTFMQGFEDEPDFTK